MKLTPEQRFVVELIVKGRMKSVTTDENELNSMVSAIVPTLCINIEAVADWSDYAHDEVCEKDVNDELSHILFQKVCGYNL